MSSPAIRARWPQRIGQWYDENRATDWQAAKVALGDRWSDIESASPTAWIAHENYQVLLHAIEVAVGAAAFGDTFGLAAEFAYHLPLFESLIRPLVRLAGRRAIVIGLPRAWQMLHRDLGTVEVEQSDHDGTTARFVGLPRVAATDPLYVEALRASLFGVMKHGGFPGTVTADGSAAADGILTYHLLATRRDPAAEPSGPG